LARSPTAPRALGSTACRCAGAAARRVAFGVRAARRAGRAGRADGGFGASTVTGGSG